ncbi:MAG: hypothetical protein H8Z69_03050 [Nanohaloarchaea archaeon]|nr:hypothetical protein [Candidatus Nanohaloarchaea archaeon]
MRKGMSQTLTLIVAASVLMMTALTVIFMVQGGLSDVFGSSNTQSCYNSVQSTCEFSDSGNHPTPESCSRADVSSVPVDGGSVDVGSNTYSCS